MTLLIRTPFSLGPGVTQGLELEATNVQVPLLYCLAWSQSKFNAKGLVRTKGEH